MSIKALAIVAASLAVLAGPAVAADLVLAEKGRTDYQIVVPDAVQDPEIGEWLTQAARLIQTVFKVNDADLATVSESRRDPLKPGIYLGDTDFARQNGVAVADLKGWGYVHKAVGRNLIVAGHDRPPAARPEGPRESVSFEQLWPGLGTVKGVADLLRQYAGVRFLYPDLWPWASATAFAAVNPANSPYMEIQRTAVLAVPADLNVRKTPFILYNTGYPRESLYDMANNMYPVVDISTGGHTYERAIPVDLYWAKHPEYFALINHQRLKQGQYCISNPEVQELFFQDLINCCDRGYEIVSLGQPDGYQCCQCDNCRKLFGTGDDWSEKIWILHRNLVERVLKARPDKKVMVMAYMHTEKVPKTFKSFPKNTVIMLCGTNEKDFEEWRAIDVPGGFTSYLYNWCPNQGGVYTPMRTPLFVEAQVKRLYTNHVQGIQRDGAGLLFGLEGPVYYTMGRMLDDPEHNQAKDLMDEFCAAAFGNVSAPMRQFYNTLYHAIESYSDYLGTRCPAWTYIDIDGRRRKFVSDPFQLLGFLYTPDVLAALEKTLAQAEQQADKERIQWRLALVRRELNYLKSTMAVVHLYHAYQILPDRALRDRLLDAIDARNALIDSFYVAKTRTKPSTGWSLRTLTDISPKPIPGWSETLFPIHSPDHLKMTYDLYQGAFKNTAFNWDTKIMRQAPLPGGRRMVVTPVKGPVTVDSPAWDRVSAETLMGVPASAAVTLKTTVRVLFDPENVYLRLDSEWPAGMMTNVMPVGRDGDLTKQESVEICLAPTGAADKFYRFRVGPSADSRYDAAVGFIADPMDPRWGLDDPSWNGDWSYQARLEPEKNRWVAMLAVPFKTLGVESPKGGTVWIGNIGRVHVVGSGRVERSIWSARPDTQEMNAPSFGEMAFEQKPAP